MFSEILYIRKKGSRRITLSLLANDVVKVSFPYHMPLFLAKVFFLKEKGVLEKLRLVKEERKNYLINTYQLSSQLFTSHAPKKIEEYKKEAYQYVTECLQALSQKVPFIYTSVSIKNTKTRWGSCSSKKSLSFHYKILFLPEDLAEYLLIHELCHLQEMNHSKKFWDLVDQFCTNYESKRKLLGSIPCV